MHPLCRLIGRSCDKSSRPTVFAAFGLLLLLISTATASSTGRHRNKNNNNNNNLSGSEVRTRNLDRPFVSITNVSSSAELVTPEETGEDDDEDGREEDQVPEVPYSLRAKPTGTTIHVTWIPPKSSKTLIRGYTVGWGIGVPDVYSKVLERNHRSFTITDLNPKSEYVISLRGYNNMGDGPPAYETVRTLASESTGSSSTPQIFPPVGLEAHVLSSSAVIVKWSDTALSTRQSVPDDRYYVVRYTSNFRSASPKYKHVNSSKTNIMIDDLKASTQYEFAVKAVRGRQESTWSMSVVNSTLESAPSSEPRDLTVVADPSDNPSTIRLQWQPPKTPNGQITGYVILYTTDDNLNDRDWSVQALVGDKMNTVLKNLLPDTTYYFKIQAQNEKGPGPVSPPVRFHTLSQNQATIVLDTKAVTPQSLIAVVIGIVALTMALVLLIVVLLCKTKGSDGHKRKGYSAAAASSPRNNKSKRVSRELNPPDLWIHHTEQLELKSMDKNPDLAPTPVLRTFQDVLVGQDERSAVTSSYASDSLYDDVSRRTAVSPAIDCSAQMISSYPSGTSTIRRTARAKPIMIPVDSGVNTIGAVFEPSTGLSRPVYPRAQSYSMHKPQICYDMGDGPLPAPLSAYDQTNGHYGHQHQQLSHHQHHQGMQPFPAPTLSSNNVSYSSGGSSLQSPIMNDPPPPPSLTHCLTTSSPSINNLSLRPLTLQSLRSFNNSIDANAPNTPKHIAVKPQMSTSPMKKVNGSGFNTISGKPTPHIVNPSFKDDFESPSYQQTHEELSRDLDGIMKELNAITSPEYDPGNH